MVSLRVLDGPSFISSLTDEEVLVGHAITFSCSATANPMPTVAWSIRGVQLPSSSEIISISQGGGKLTISKAETTDAAAYTCTATTVVTDRGSLVTRTVSSTAQLLVIGEYVGSYCLCSNLCDSNVNVSAWLLCVRAGVGVSCVRA